DRHPSSEDSMPDRQRPRLLRSISLGPLVSLTVVVGLSASLGLARTVWGGPPADSPSAEPAVEEAPAGELAVDPTADPAATTPDSADLPADLPPADPLPVDETAASVPGASSLRA